MVLKNIHMLHSIFGSRNISFDTRGNPLPPTPTPAALCVHVLNFTRLPYPSSLLAPPPTFFASFFRLPPRHLPPSIPRYFPPSFSPIPWLGWAWLGVGTLLQSTATATPTTTSGTTSSTTPSPAACSFTSTVSLHIYICMVG